MESKELGNSEKTKLRVMENLTGCRVVSFDGKYLEISFNGEDYRSLTNRGELVEAVFSGRKILELRMSENSNRTILFSSVLSPSGTEEKEDNITKNKKRFMTIH